MIILHTAGELRQWRQAQHGSIGFVPTMGNLHAGHLSLLRAARDQHPVAIASLFVNARQFDSADELNAYPVTVDADRDQLEKLGFDALFLPTASEVYPADFGTVVTPGSAARKWEGAFRPGHLEGVCTIVAKLFNLVQPDEAYFGEKDFQQLKVVAAMVRDLNIPVVISACPTIREADGLALSSRNSRIDPRLRPRANAMIMQLKSSAEAIQKGAAVTETENAARTALEGAGFVVDYFALVDAASLEPLASAISGARLLAAASLGGVRLIDNYPV